MTGTAQYHGGAAGDYAKRDKGRSQQPDKGAPTNSSPHHQTDAAPHGRPFDCRRASEKAVVASSVEG
jgi:hypothetical protein